MQKVTTAILQALWIRFQLKPPHANITSPPHTSTHGLSTSLIPPSPQQHIRPSILLQNGPIGSSFITVRLWLLGCWHGLKSCFSPHLYQCIDLWSPDNSKCGHLCWIDVLKCYNSAFAAALFFFYQWCIPSHSSKRWGIQTYYSKGILVTCLRAMPTLVCEPLVQTIT